MGEKRNACRVVGKPEKKKKREHFDDLSVDGRIIFKKVSKKENGRV